MAPVFGHGRLRLYLLKLLDEGDRHGYEMIRLLEDRFMGLYAPSAGTIYPRLARLEADGLVMVRQEGGRKVYQITDAGRAELRARAAELAALEREISNSVDGLAREIGATVHGSARDLRAELRQAARQVRRSGEAAGRPKGAGRGRWDWRGPRLPDVEPEPAAEPQAADRRAEDRSREPNGPGLTTTEVERRLQAFRDEVRDLLHDTAPDEARLAACVRVLDEAAARIGVILRRTDQ